MLSIRLPPSIKVLGAIHDNVIVRKKNNVGGSLLQSIIILLIA